MLDATASTRIREIITKNLCLPLLPVIEELATSEGIQHGILPLVADIVCRDGGQRGGLSRKNASLQLGQIIPEFI